MPAESGFDQGKAEAAFAEFIPKIKQFAEKKPEEITQDELNAIIGDVGVGIAVLAHEFRRRGRGVRPRIALLYDPVFIGGRQIVEEHRGIEKVPMFQVTRHRQIVINKTPRLRYIVDRFHRQQLIDQMLGRAEIGH